MAALSFFIGKGGVGKTTVSAAYAVRQAVAHPRKRVLLLSTDPAHSLADVFEQSMGPHPQPLKLPGRGNLHGWQIDAESEFNRFLDHHRDSILDLVEGGTFFTREEIEPLLKTTVPGVAEISALLAIHDLLESGEYDEIVTDTAPVGHTLRLFEMPEHFSRFLHFLETASSRDAVLAQRFGGSGQRPKFPFLESWRAMVDQVKDALSSEMSRLVLVTSAESFSLHESVRARDALRHSLPGLPVSSIVLNRVVKNRTQCGTCLRKAKNTAAAATFLASNFRGTPVLLGEDSGAPILGAEGLLDFGRHVFDGERLSAIAKAGTTSPEIPMAEVTWPALGAPLSFTLGKGGVGKTTVSAAMALHSLQRGRRSVTTICSTDPAPSLDDVFDTEVGDQPVAVTRDGRLRAAEIDSVAEFDEWSEGMRAKVQQSLTTERGGIHVDLSFERAVFSALLDIVPPGVDEIFSIFRIVELLGAGSKHVVIDMAPTGHALELLRMPDRILLWARLLLKTLAQHRKLPLAQSVAVEIAEISHRVRGLAEMLQQPESSSVWPVMLPEPMPDRETSRLLKDLKTLDVPVRGLIVNRVIFAEDAGRCARCNRARQWQMRTLWRLRKERKGSRAAGSEIYLVRNQTHEIRGEAALRKLTQTLWRMK